MPGLPETDWEAVRPLRLRRCIGGKKDGPSRSSASSAIDGVLAPAATARKW